MPEATALTSFHTVPLGTIKGRPTGIVELPDANYVLVSLYQSRGSGPAVTVRVDGSEPPQPMDRTPGESTSMQPMATGGYMLVSHDADRVFRTGRHTWCRTIAKPLFLLWRGPVVFVSEQDAGIVHEIDINTGATLREIGRGALTHANGMALGRGGELYVGDHGNHNVHVRRVVVHDVCGE